MIYLDRFIRGNMVTILVSFFMKYISYNLNQNVPVGSFTVVGSANIPMTTKTNYRAIVTCNPCK